jgi:uncharacterized protein
VNTEPAPPLDISFASGGEICRAWHFPPQHEGMAKYLRSPCVVMGHGFGGTRDAGLMPYARRFVAEGMHVIIFDYRHFGASDGEPRQLISIKKQLEDWAAAAAFARDMDGVDPSRVALWGTSFSAGHVVITSFFDRRVAAVISQCPALDGISLVLAHLQYAGIIPGFRLLWAGIQDQIGALLRRGPAMLPLVAKPGSLAFLSSPDSEPGIRAIAPAGFHNEIAARIVLEVPFYRPIRRIYDLSCPQLQQICDRDVIAPPPNIELHKQPRGRRNIVVRNYDCGHFDLYQGEWFEAAVADQIAFLKAVFS